MYKSNLTQKGSGLPTEEKTVALNMASGDQIVYPSEGKTMAKVTVQKPDTMLPENMLDGVNIGGVVGTYQGGGGTQPQLNAVTITRARNIMTIMNPSSNGTYVVGYKLYNNGTLLDLIDDTDFDLETLGVGDFVITVKASGINFTDSDSSNSLSFSVYSVTQTLTDLGSTYTKQAIIEDGLFETTFTPAAGKYRPRDIVISLGGNGIPYFTYELTELGALFDYRYVDSTGVLTLDFVLLNDVGDLIVTAIAMDYPVLDTPTSIAMNGDSFNFNLVDNATRYSIFVWELGGFLPYSTTSPINLSNLFNGQADGIYHITLIAQSEGTYQSSRYNNAYIYLVGVAPIYGVAGMYDSSPTLTRTDQAIGKTYVRNASAGTIASDFDDLFPWNIAVKETDALGNSFLHLPEMYFRVGCDASYRITDIAVSQKPSGEGSWYKVDEFWYGCYGAYKDANNKLLSISGVSRLRSTSRANLRTYAANTGSNYRPLDLYHSTAMKFLWMIEFATKNSNSIIAGQAASSALSPCGTTDTLTTPTGWKLGPSYYPMRYHYIEDFVGNCFEFIDGIVGQSSLNSSLYATNNPVYFSDTTSGKSLLCYTGVNLSPGCVAAIGWDADNPFECMPCESVNNASYNTYFCDLAYYSGASAYNTGSYYQGNQEGLYANTNNSGGVYVAGRLLYVEV